ncbi:MAG: DUF5063 domain-containing protein [Syntrophothermus sp.]
MTENKPADYPSDPVYSRKVLEMLTVANEFCLFLEKSEDYPKEDVLKFLQKIIPLIYIKASLLPDIDVADEEMSEHFVTEEQWEDMFNVLRAKFGDDDIFYFVDHHEKSNQDGIRASLSECFTDIYQDLKDFVLLYQKPIKASMEIAVRDCKQLFETRYGYRMVNAHSAIHYLLCTEGEKGELSNLIDSL